MKSKYIRIDFIITVVFVISMIYTTSQLFSLQDKLILGVSALSTDDISELSLVLNPVYIVVAVSLVLGLISILFTFKTDNGGASQLTMFSQ